MRCVLSRQAKRTKKQEESRRITGGEQVKNARMGQNLPAPGTGSYSRTQREQTHWSPSGLVLLQHDGVVFAAVDDGFDDHGAGGGGERDKRAVDRGQSPSGARSRRR